MALHLHFSDHLDVLLPQLLQDLGESWKDPMAPPRVVVPSPSTGNWLQLRIARELGAIANLSMLTLERLLWRALEPSSEMRLLGAPVVSQVLAALLRTHMESQDPVFAPVRAYMESGSSGVDENKLIQLSGRLAALLCEYEYNRPPVWNTDRRRWMERTGVDEAWLNGRRFFAEADEKAEAWQRALYQELFSKENGKFSMADSGWMTLPRLYRNTLEQDPDWVPKDKSPVLLVQVSKISHFHRNMLLELSRHLELHVYLTNPCAEFWEDVPSVRAGRARRSWNSSKPGIRALQSEEYARSSLAELPGYLPTDLDDNRLLQLWGKTGKENISLWCQAADYNFCYTCDESESESLLSQVQRAVRSRLPVKDLLASPGDSSLALYAAPTRLREVEHMRECLLNRLASDTSLRLDEVGVYVTDVESYQSSLELVFGSFAPGESGHMPYSLLGRSGAESLVAQGLRDLIGILGGDFSRGAVFRFLRNPLVYGRLRLERSEVEIWENWAAQIGIYRGADKAQREASGDAAAASDEHTFGWGAARLMAGSLASGPIDLGLRTAEGDVLGVLAYRDFETGDGNLVSKFVSTWEKLHAQEGLLRAGSHESLAEQWKWLTICLEEWLAPFGKPDGWDQNLEARCWRTLWESLALVPLQQEVAERTSAMGVDEVLATLRSLIPQAEAEAAKGWNGVLTMAPLRAGHILPHRHVFVLGLDSQLFPGNHSQAPLDLIATRRILGDADLVSDNRFAFLELLQAARESLSFSYLALDVQKDCELLPSSVLLELETVLVAGGCPENEPESWFRHTIPLLARSSGKGWDPYERGLAAQSQAVLRNGQRAAYRLPCGLQAQAPARLEKEAKAPVSGLRRFLVNPWEYHLQERLGWRGGEEESTLQVSDDPLALDPLSRSGFFARVLRWLLEQPGLRRVQGPGEMAALLGALDQELPRWKESLRQEGALPQSWFGAAVQQELYASARQLAFSFASYCLRPCGKGLSEASYMANYAWSRKSPDKALRTTLRMQLHNDNFAELTGGVPHVLCNHDHIWVLGKGRLLDSSGKKRIDKWLELLLQGVLVRLGGWGKNITLLGFDLSSGKLEGVPLNLGAEELECWCGELLSQMLVHGSGEHLPLAVVAKHWNLLKKGTKESRLEFYEMVSAELEESGAWASYKCYVEDWDLGEPRNAFAMEPESMSEVAISRYGCILDCLRQDGEAEDEA